MICEKCKSDALKAFNGELAIHFPGVEGLNKPIVWVFPKVMICLDCGDAEFAVPPEQLRQLQDREPVRSNGIRRRATIGRMTEEL